MTATASCHDFHVDDRVAFPHGRSERSARIERLNPKRARVVCDDDRVFDVPYELLRLVRPSARRATRDATTVAATARQLLSRHGLADWRFDFDHAKRRAAACHFDRSLITMSLEFARNAPEPEVHDAILHEIAHALVGPRHGHGPRWQAMARAIGCSGERCHDVEFSRPRYILRCSQGCFAAKANRKRYDTVCRRCHAAVEYLGFSDELWRQLGVEGSP